MPRHRFVPTELQRFAYYDMSLPIGEGQTISPPFIVAQMTQKLSLKADDNVLEIGTGSGYQAAILSRLVKEVHTIEIVEPLATRASGVFEKLGYRNIHARWATAIKAGPRRRRSTRSSSPARPSACRSRWSNSYARGAAS